MRTEGAKSQIMFRKTEGCADPIGKNQFSVQILRGDYGPIGGWGLPTLGGCAGAG